MARPTFRFRTVKSSAFWIALALAASPVAFAGLASFDLTGQTRATPSATMGSLETSAPAGDTATAPSPPTGLTITRMS